MKKATKKTAKKTQSRIYLTRRAALIFGVVSLLSLSTFGLLYNNMFNASAAGLTPRLSNCGYAGQPVRSTAQDSSSNRTFVLQFRTYRRDKGYTGWETVASSYGYRNGSQLARNGSDFLAKYPTSNNRVVEVRSYTISGSSNISGIATCNLYYGA